MSILGSGFHGSITAIDDLIVVKTVQPECLIEAYLTNNHNCSSLIRQCLPIEIDSTAIKMYYKRASCDLHNYMIDNDLNSDEIHFIVVEVLKALVCLHSSGVIHNDVKRENILIYPDGKVVLADLSLSTLTSWTRITSACTVVHRPPEGWSRDWNEKVDSWAFSSMLYTILTNEYLLPIGDKDSYKALYSKIERRIFNDIRIPGMFKDPILGGLRISPTARWSCTELLTYFDSSAVDCRVDVSRCIPTPRLTRRINFPMTSEEIELYKELM